MLTRSAALALFVLLTAVPALAAPPPVSDGTHFTSQGRSLVSGRLAGAYTEATPVGGYPGPSWWLSISPGLLYFVRERVGLGAFTSISVSRATRVDATVLTLGVGAQALYDWRLADRVSLLIAPYLAYRLGRNEWREVSVGQSGLELGVSLPLTYHASSAVALGLGPSVSSLWQFAASQRGVEPGTLVDSSGGLTVGLNSFIGYSF
jgi:hypothetical protein